MRVNKRQNSFALAPGCVLTLTPAYFASPYCVLSHRPSSVSTAFRSGISYSISPSFSHWKHHLLLEIAIGLQLQLKTFKENQSKGYSKGVNMVYFYLGIIYSIDHLYANRSVEF